MAAAETICDWGGEGQSGASADVAEYPEVYCKSPLSSEEREPICCCFCDDVGVMRPVSMLALSSCFPTEQTFDFVFCK